MRRYKILVVDDEHLIRWSLEQNLKKHGYEVLSCGSGEEALRLLHEETPDLILLDILLPGINGVEVLERAKEIDEDVIIIMLTALGVLETAVRAMRLGAYDYINKPFNLDELAIIIKKSLENQELKREVAQLRTTQPKKFNVDTIVSESDELKRILNMVLKIAQSDAGTVLIQGESGTGKELIAKAVHYESGRADRPFVAINCAAVPETLLESELMGHEKGAFTDARTQKKGLFEIADGGTVFLDEIGDMPLSIQAKLLRVLEDRVFRRVGGTKDIHVDVRIVSATNKDLLKAIEEKTFRNDLYYRLQVLPILLPPLRDRRADILPLTRTFIENFNLEFGKSVKGISPQAEAFLLDYAWPGNVRELRNVIERAIILEDDEIMQLEHLPREIVCSPTATQDNCGLSFNLPPEGIDIEDVERELIHQALQATDGNQSKAARKLNLGIDAFRYRMKKFKLL